MTSPQSEESYRDSGLRRAGEQDRKEMFKLKEYWTAQSVYGGTRKQNLGLSKRRRVRPARKAIFTQLNRPKSLRDWVYLFVINMFREYREIVPVTFRAVTINLSLW